MAIVDPLVFDRPQAILNHQKKSATKIKYIKPLAMSNALHNKTMISLQDQGTQAMFSDENNIIDEAVVDELN